MTRFMRQNHGLVTLARLRRLGFSEDEVRGLVRHGDLRRMHRGVYADGRAQLTDRGRLHAALLAVNHGGAWIAGASAAALWGLTPGVPAQIDVTLVAAHTARHPGLRIRRVGRPPHPSEIRRRNGLRVSSIPRLLIETAAAGAAREQLDALLEAAVRRDRLDIPDLAAALNRNRGRRGTAPVAAMCEEYLPRTSRKSGLERSFDRWLVRHPEIPEPERNIHLGPWEIDCYWPDHRLALELDGRPYHSLMRDVERDHRKNTWLQVHGIRILRITDRRWKRDRPGAHHDLVTMLAPHQRDADDLVTTLAPHQRDSARAA